MDYEAAFTELFDAVDDVIYMPRELRDPENPEAYPGTHVNMEHVPALADLFLKLCDEKEKE